MTPLEPPRKRQWAAWILGLAIFAGLYGLSRFSYPVFHSFVETCCAVVCWSTFVVAWNSRHYLSHAFYLVIGVAALAAGILHLLHMLAHPGLEIFPGFGPDLRSQLWIGSRFVMAASLLVAPFFLSRKINVLWLWAVIATVTGLFLAALFTRHFPVCYIPGVGLTPFKIGSEFLICAFFGAALFFLSQRRALLDPYLFRLLSSSVAVAIMADLLFTLCRDPNDSVNFAGHIFTLGSFALLYKAVAESGMVRPLESLFRDISLSRERERELSGKLATEHGRVLAVLESIGDGFFSVNRDWEFTYINEKGLAIIRKEREELLHRSLWETFPRIKGTSFGALLERTMQERVPGAVEAYYAPLEGWFETRAYPSESGLSVFFQNITERKTAEEALRENQRRLDISLAAGGLAAWEIDLDTGEVRGSERLREIFGISPEVEINFRDHWQQFVLPEDRITVQDAMRQAWAENKRYKVEFRIRRPDGEVRWIASEGETFRSENGGKGRLVGVCSDVTERKNAEQELQSARLAAEEANQAKDQFLAVLSHELRTPLTPVLLGLSLLERADPDSADVVEMIRRNIHLEARLIDDLLDLTRIARGKIELARLDVDLREPLRRAVDICKPDIEEKSFRFEYGVTDEALICRGDPARLQQIFWNLLKNAAKFTPPGGRITLEASRNDGHATVRVSDNGIGIASDAKSRIFSAFEQANKETLRRFGGLGLGLAISKALVELHGGQITVESEGEGKGATFTVVLPLQPAGREGLQ